MRTLFSLASTSLFAFAAFASVGLAAAQAQTAPAQKTLSFDSFTSPAQANSGYYYVGTTYSTQGFTFNSNGSGFFALAGKSLYGDGETSIYSNSAGSTTLTQDSGQTFSLNAIDLGPVFSNAAGTSYAGPVLFTGTKADGATVTLTQTTTSSKFQTFDFTNFTGLKSLTFSGIYSPCAGETSVPEFDNVVVTPSASPAAVPEPSSLTVMGFAAVGILGLILRTRKRSAAPAK